MQRSHGPARGQLAQEAHRMKLVSASRASKAAICEYGDDPRGVGSDGALTHGGSCLDTL